jgi:hypothetical protein
MAKMGGKEKPPRLIGGLSSKIGSKLLKGQQMGKGQGLIEGAIKPKTYFYYHGTPPKPEPIQ